MCPGSTAVDARPAPFIGILSRLSSIIGLLYHPTNICNMKLANKPATFVHKTLQRRTCPRS